MWGIIVLMLCLASVSANTPDYDCLPVYRNPNRVVEVDEIPKGQTVMMCSGQVVKLPFGTISYRKGTLITRETIISERICGDHSCGQVEYRTIPRFFTLKEGYLFDINNDYVFEILEFNTGYIVYRRL